tara:strand:+ start:578 stop:739 length:162 start_codon:yes stop_codon:yes gene_type:complete
MNEELKKKMWELSKLALRAIELSGEEDDHWKVCLNLTIYKAEEILKMTGSEEE